MEKGENEILPLSHFSPFPFILFFTQAFLFLFARFGVADSRFLPHSR
jgi:hypothetical protein